MMKFFSQKLLLLFITAVLFACGNVGKSTNHSALAANIGDVNGSAVFISSLLFNLPEGNTSTSGTISLSGGNNKKSYTLTFNITNAGTQASSMKLPIVATTSTDCILNVINSSSCQININRNNAQVGTYDVVPVLTDISTHINTQLKPFIIIVSRQSVTSQQGNLSLSLNESQAFNPIVATITLSNSVNLNNIVVSINDSNSQLISLSANSCTLSTTNNSCNINISNSSATPTSSIITISANSYNNLNSISFTLMRSHYVYAISAVSGDISQFRVDPNTGILSPLAESVIATNNTDAAEIITSPTAPYIYVTNEASHGFMSMYKINDTTGQLSPLTPPTVGDINKPIFMTITPDGKYSYVIGTLPDVLMYSIAESGILAPNSTESSIAIPGEILAQMTVSPSGKYAYVPVVSENAIHMFHINNDGILVPADGENPATGQQPIYMAITPSESYAYVVNIADQTISMYSIDTNGRLNTIAESPVATGSFPCSITITPSSSYVYVTNLADNSISMYKIQANGALIPLANPAKVTTILPEKMAIDSQGKYAYVTNLMANLTSEDNGSISIFNIRDDGQLVPLSPESSVLTSPFTVGITVY